MTSAVKIFHNPRCSKSRQTMQLLESNGVTPEIVDYLKQPPGYDELAETLAARQEKAPCNFNVG